MNTDKLPLSEVISQLTKDCPVFTLPPLMPEQMEANRLIADKVLERVFEGLPEPSERESE